MNSLAAAALTHKGYSGASSNVQAEVFEDLDLWPCGVCKCDILQLDVALYTVRLLAIFLIVYFGLPACSLTPVHQYSQQDAHSH